MTRVDASKEVRGAAPLYGRVCEILDAARAHVARTVNTTQVTANWLIGREMVEEEQRGKRRADYGRKLVVQLSAQLTTAYGKGWSAQSLFYMKQFYLAYPGLMEKPEQLQSSTHRVEKALTGSPVHCIPT